MRNKIQRGGKGGRGGRSDPAPTARVAMQSETSQSEQDYWNQRLDRFEKLMEKQTEF